MVPQQGKSIHCLSSHPIERKSTIFPGSNLIYWQNPVQSGIVLGLSISVIITFMFLSSLAAIAFWLLAFLLITGLYKLYNYVMTTFVGRVQDDLFEYVNFIEEKT